MPSPLFRPAFTLVELLVVLAIVATLLGLLLAAIQQVRQAAARAACGNHLRQLALAVHSYHDAHRTLPPSRIEDAWATWAVLLLPHLEQEAAFRAWNLSRRYHEQSDTARLARVAVFYCPARRQPGPFSQAPADARSLEPAFPHTPGELSDYAACGGSGAGNNEQVDSRGVFIRAVATWSGPRTDLDTRVTSWRSTLSFASISDGLSQTLLLGDKHIRPDRFATSLEDSSVFNGDHTYGYIRYAGLQTDDGRVTARRPLVSNRFDARRAAQRFGSWHPGICQFTFADASVRGLSNTTDLTVLTRLADRADGFAVEGF